MVNVWPPSLPGPLVGSTSEERVPTYIEDSAEVGAAKRRSRYSRSLRRLSFSMILTEAQVADLDTFYETTLVRGTDRFEWDHWRTGDTLNVRFEEYPRIAGISNHGTKSQVNVILMEV